MILAIIATAIGVVSIGGAAYLLALWHDDERDLRASGRWRGWLRTWPFSRVLAYVGAGTTAAAVYLAALTILRVVLAGQGVDFAPITQALTPLTIAALLYLLAAFPIVAGYLRLLRRRNHRRRGEPPSRLPAIDSEG